jgi:hypothetical protein
LSRGIGLQYLPPPDQLEIAWHARGVCLVCESDSEETYELLRQLHERKWQVVLISLFSSEQKYPFEVPRYYVDTLDEAKVKGLVEMITTQYGPIVGFIALGSNVIVPDVVSLLGQQSEKRYVDFVFLMATQLKSALQNGAIEARTWFVTVNSIDGQFGLSESSDMKGVVSGGLSALTKTLQREWPQVFCRAVDFSPELSAIEKSQLLVKELFDADRSLVEVGYVQNRRYTITPMESIEC